MFKKFFFTSFLLLSSLITIFPSKKENTNFFDYCYSLEKIISRNTVEKSKNLSKNFKPLVKDISLLVPNREISFAKVLKLLDRLLFFSIEFLEIIFSRE